MDSKYAPHIDSDELVQFACDLISKDTTNPPGNEYLCEEIIIERMQSIGLYSEVLAKKDKRRSNVIGICGSGEKSLCLTAHMDVVPAGPLDLWTITKPFEPKVLDGKIYGRGASDDKGAFVALYGGLKAFLKVHPGFDGKIYLVASADEEEGSALGWLFLLNEVGLRFDAAIVADGGRLNECIYGEKGLCQIAIKSYGKQAHASLPHLGFNAITALSRLIVELDKIKLLKIHPEFTASTINVGLIRGGIAHNVVPGFAEALIDLRLPPGLDGEAVVLLINKQIQLLKKDCPEARFEAAVIKETQPHLNDLNQPIFQSFKKAAEKLGIEMKFITMGGNTDAKKMAGVGIPAVVHHPKNASTAHMADEYIETENLVKAAVLYAKTIEEYFKN